MPTLVRRLDRNHDMVFGRGARNYASGAESTAQRVRSAILLVLGEWFLDTSRGVPWLQLDGSDARPILGGRPDLPYAEAVLKAAILAVDGVAAISAFTLTFESKARKLSVAAKLTTIDGDIENIQVDVNP